MSGFSLWLLPPPAVRDRFYPLIDELSRRLGTPAFEPHLTLAGTSSTVAADVTAQVATLAAGLAPLPIHLTEIGMTADYFRCLFVHAELTPPLQRAYHATCRALGQPPGDFMPHLSLVYGDLAPADKKRVVADIGRRFDLHFIVERVALYTTAGPPPAWRCVADFALTGT